MAETGHTLTERSALDLAAAIGSGEVSSREVVDAHIALVERVNPGVNALIAERFDRAREEADRADARVAAGAGAGADELPPLHGVPCTIKESIQLEGMPNSAGVVTRAAVRSERSASPVIRLIEAGAIPLGVTNTSELTMWVESVNRVYGRTNNAYDRRRTAGGSSGGEGSAVGSGFAPFGLGSDIGGSIRLPAFFNGVFGHKPTPGLVPTSGQYPPAVGGSPRLLGVGPLARRAEDLMPVLRALAGPDGEDDFAREMPLGDPGEVSIDGLAVQLAERTSYVNVSRELRSAREGAARALTSAGADVRPIELKKLRRAQELYVMTLKECSPASIGSMLADAGQPSPKLRQIVSRSGPHTTAVYALGLAERLPTPPRLLKRMLAAGEALGKELVETIGDGVLLAPSFPRVAPRHGGITARPRGIMHMTAFNLAGVPVTQAPLGLNQAGVPLGVQIVAAPGNDHVAIAVALELERALGGWVPPRR